MKIEINELIRSFFENVLGIRIKRMKDIPTKEDKPGMKLEYVHDPAFSYMVDQEYRDQLIDELAAVADASKIGSFIPKNTVSSPGEIIKDFFDIYSSRGETDNSHGSGFHNAFWLYYLARILNPELIVESGVWRGHTAWLLSKACPDADQYGFDIKLKYLEYPDIDVQYIENDWQSYSFPSFDPDRSLIFFDCHINHARRLIEAKSKGFKHIIFDDNPPIHKIYSLVPGIPTAAMLHSGDGIDRTEISWSWNGKKYTEPIDLEQARQARELIKIHYTLPDVGGLTRYGGFAFLTYVQI